MYMDIIESHHMLCNPSINQSTDLISSSLVKEITHSINQSIDSFYQ